MDDSLQSRTTSEHGAGDDHENTERRNLGKQPKTDTGRRRDLIAEIRRDPYCALGVISYWIRAGK